MVDVIWESHEVSSDGDKILFTRQFLDSDGFVNTPEIVAAFVINKQYGVKY